MLSQPKLKLAPSILAADFARLGEQVVQADQGGADMIHIDVMDGHFVPNISFGPHIVEVCKRVTTLPLDVHLMISQPERYFADFARAGAFGLTVHAEVTQHLHRAVQHIKDLGLKAGVVLNPGTPLEFLKPLLRDVDLVLIMTVNPGFGGQKFIESALERIEVVRGWLNLENPNCDLQVDGGITLETIGKAKRAGANVFVAGSSVFGDGNIAQNIANLKNALLESV